MGYMRRHKRKCSRIITQSTDAEFRFIHHRRICASPSHNIDTEYFTSCLICHIFVLNLRLHTLPVDGFNGCRGDLARIFFYSWNCTLKFLTCFDWIRPVSKEKKEYSTKLPQLDREKLPKGFLWKWGRRIKSPLQAEEEMKRWTRPVRMKNPTYTVGWFMFMYRISIAKSSFLFCTEIILESSRRAPHFSDLPLILGYLTESLILILSAWEKEINHFSFLKPKKKKNSSGIL